MFLDTSGSDVWSLTLICFKLASWKAPGATFDPGPRNLFKGASWKPSGATSELGSRNGSKCLSYGSTRFYMLWRIRLVEERVRILSGASVLWKHVFWCTHFMAARVFKCSGASVLWKHVFLVCWCIRLMEAFVSVQCFGASVL